jgi:hypothetical protein
MKTEDYIKKVKASKEYKKFIKENPDAYLCSLFFIREYKEGKKHKETHIDFYVPSKNLIFNFKVDGKVKLIPLGKKAETIKHEKLIPKEIKEKIKLDIDEIRPILHEEMLNRNITYDIEKLLVFLGIFDDRLIWNCTGFLKGLGLLQAHIDDESGSVLFMDKKSFFDLIKFQK